MTLAAMDAAGAASVDRCGTAHVTVVGAERISAPPRPAGYTQQIASTHFRVHSLPAGDPGYAQAVSDAAEHTWRVLMDTLGFVPPPSDGILGGDARLDIYVQPVAAIGAVWGVTWSETLVGGIYPNRYSSWMAVVDTMGASRRDAVTAHEVFHTVQLGYDRDENASFLEMISTWVEERAYDDSNVYYEVLPPFFNEPHRALFGQTYSNVPWMIYLTLIYGDALLADILHQCGLVGGANVVAAHDAALPLHGGNTLTAELPRFAAWNYHTGARDDGLHYPEGAAWPEVFTELRTTCVPHPEYATAHRYGTFGANYFFYDGNYQDDTLRVNVVPEWFNTTSVSVIRYKSGTPTTQTVLAPAMTPVVSLAVADWSACDSVIVVTQKTGGPVSLADARLSAWFPLSGSPILPWVLLLDRDNCGHPFDGIADAFTTRDGEERPWAASLGARGIPFVQRDSIPWDLTACRGIILVGGFNTAGPNISDAEFDRLVTYLDGGGHIYMESRRIGEWLDPGTGSPSPAQLAFWTRFGVGYQTGAGSGTGNVLTWQTVPGAPGGPLAFIYDFQSTVDDGVGTLVPVTSDSLALDQSGAVRMSLQMGAGATRILSTVALGGSTGPGDARDRFVQSIVDLWGLSTPAMSVTFMRAHREGHLVRFRGAIEHYDGSALSLIRGTTQVPLSVLATDEAAFIVATDRSAPDDAVYTLVATRHNGTQVGLWSGTAGGRGSSPPLALHGVAPNPLRDTGHVMLESDGSADVEVSLYDVRGRVIWMRVWSGLSGMSTLSLEEAIRGRAAGVYFLRVSSGHTSASRKVLILR